MSKNSDSAGVNRLANQAKPGTGKVLDGFIKRTAQNVHRSAERSKTLMRTSVAKPAAQKTQSVAQGIRTATKNQAGILNAARASRAKVVAKSDQVKHFGILANIAPSITSHGPRKPLVGEIVANRTRQTRSANATVAVAKPLPSMITSVSHHQIERLLDQALFRADAHRKALRGELPGQSFWQKLLARPKRITAASTALAILLLAGFFAWQNIPQVSMRVAATKAHVNASLPGYVPAGFSFTGPITHNDSAVQMSFIANGDTSRTFAITQRSSSEDSASLAANNLPDDSSVQTSQINGTTVYIYGKTNDAAWVNHGVRYSIEDKASLNSDQILKIANGL